MIAGDTIGPYYRGRGEGSFAVWAPLAQEVSVVMLNSAAPLLPMEKDAKGYWEGIAENTFPGALYYYRINNAIDRPDPASNFQPQGVHGPSQLVDHGSFAWEDDGWKGMPLSDYMLYELHVGTFTRDGTFEAILSRLSYLKDLGITAIEVMPVAQFPGERNWGYDGTYPFAPQNSYGGPDGLKLLVNECHKAGIAVVLDVVYNHLGPEGNYLGDFGPYFTDRYRTPWGDAINFDGPYSDGVRDYFVSNALHWVSRYHIDALRIDAIHGIYDLSATHILKELSQAVHVKAAGLGRKVYVMAESDLNDVRVIDPHGAGGCGVDAQWNDDFHHALHTLITGESDGYYQDFGKLSHLIKAYREGFVYSGQYSAYRKRRHGNSSKRRPAERFVVFSQNHDQVGNRKRGDRLGREHSLEKLKLAAAAVILSPFIPLLFMGEEYGETAPFNYFVHHSDAALIEAIKRGRMEEFSSFGWDGPIADPQEESTFLASTLNIDLRLQGEHRILHKFYRHLIGMRKATPPLRNISKKTMEIKGFAKDKCLSVHRSAGGDEVVCFYNFHEGAASISPRLKEGTWRKMLDSSSQEWGGTAPETAGRVVESCNGSAPVSLNPWSAVVYRKV
ncbi:MAG TPA: malto-oligosyltrehalose trehalohydrolase [Syntrophorhabdaceae bacterium]|nr:malto-oligosyltrehalose trehalohydrolase [Syntrophorhabdaceae bacterium]HNT68239.1 malto-oligosyltrehalose trehalohydrolase [Syntrophorhabdaceae bacterium]